MSLSGTTIEATGSTFNMEDGEASSPMRSTIIRVDDDHHKGRHRQDRRHPASKTESGGTCTSGTARIPNGNQLPRRLFGDVRRSTAKGRPSTTPRRLRRVTGAGAERQSRCTMGDVAVPKGAILSVNDNQTTHGNDDHQ
jgi:hypothetical protein